MRAVSFNPQLCELMVSIPTSLSLVHFRRLALRAGRGGLGYLTAQYKPSRLDPLMGIPPASKRLWRPCLGEIGNIPGAVLGGLLIGLAETFVVATAKTLASPPRFATQLLSQS